MITRHRKASHPTWRQLIEDFSALRQTDLSFARVDHTWRPGEEDWRVAGSQDPHAKRRLEVASAAAGDKVLACLRSTSAEYKQLATQRSSQDRWFKALQILGGDYQLLSPNPGHDLDEVGNVVGKFYLGGIEQPLEASVTLCTEMGSRYPDAMRIETPHWVRVAGVMFGGLTLMFFAALVLLAIAGHEVPSDSRFLVVVVLGIGCGLAFSFLGGEIAAEGKVPLSLAKDYPIGFAVSGGIAVVVVMMVLGSWLYVRESSPPAQVSERLDEIRDQVAQQQPLRIYPVVDLASALELQVQLFPGDKVRVHGGAGNVTRVWFGRWEPFDPDRTYLASGKSGRPVIPRFESKERTGTLKLEILARQHRDQPRDLRRRSPSVSEQGEEEEELE